MYVYVRMFDNNVFEYCCSSVRYAGNVFVIDLGEELISFPISDILNIVVVKEKLL